MHLGRVMEVAFDVLVTRACAFHAEAQVTVASPAVHLGIGNLGMELYGDGSTVAERLVGVGTGGSCFGNQTSSSDCLALAHLPRGLPQRLSAAAVSQGFAIFYSASPWRVGSLLANPPRAKATRLRGLRRCGASTAATKSCGQVAPEWFLRRVE